MVLQKSPQVVKTPRLFLEPLEVYHADKLYSELLDPRLYKYIPLNPPASLEVLRKHYQRLALRHSPCKTQVWLNWALWNKAESCYVGTVQATLFPPEICQTGL